MTRDEVIQLAHEAKLGTTSPVLPYIERFAVLVAAAEREACARVCEERHANGNFKHDTREDCAAAIRARGES